MQHNRIATACRHPADGEGIVRQCLVPLLLVLMAVGMLNAGPVWAQTQVINISDGQRTGKVTVAAGKSETLRLSEPFENIVVGNPDIADVAPLTDQSLYVLGRDIGTTNLAVYNADRELIAVVEIEVTYDVSGMREALTAALPAARIHIRTIGGRIMLQGTVPDAVVLDRALAIARDFAGDNVTNALNVASPQQVMLEVRMIEATRSLGRDLGVNWRVDAGGFRFSTLRPAHPLPPEPGEPRLIGGAPLVSGATPFGSLLSSFLAGGAQVDVLIQALEAKGIARRLAEPNLIALSGQPASFHAGGEFPVPTLNNRSVGTEGDEAVVQSVEFKPFGVRLNFTPTVLADGVINIVIEPEVSEPDFANAVRGIPSVSTRRARTTVELRDGQSLAMAGLLQSNHSRNAEQVPWLGDVPILGALFRSSGFQRNETELVVIVTPRLILPVPPGVALATPLDNLTASNDPEMVLLGKLEVTKEHLHLIETGGAIKGPFGHMLDLPEAYKHVHTK